MEPAGLLSPRRRLAFQKHGAPRASHPVRLRQAAFGSSWNGSFEPRLGFAEVTPAEGHPHDEGPGQGALNPTSWLLLGASAGDREGTRHS